MNNGVDQATRAGAAAASKSTGELLWLVARSTAALTGDALFRSLVSELAVALNLMHVFVTECLDFPTTRVRTLAYWSKTGLRDNVEFNLGGFPCEETIRENRVCWIPDHLAQTYPKEAAYGRESYYGLPIVQPETGRVIGHFAFFDDKRMERDVFDDPLFHIFAALAGAELQRREAEAERAGEVVRHLRTFVRKGQIQSFPCSRRGSRTKTTPRTSTSRRRASRRGGRRGMPIRAGASAKHPGSMPPTPWTVWSCTRTTEAADDTAHRYPAPCGRYPMTPSALSRAISAAE